MFLFYSDVRFTFYPTRVGRKVKGGRLVGGLRVGRGLGWQV